MTLFRWQAVRNGRGHDKRLGAKPNEEFAPRGVSREVADREARRERILECTNKGALDTCASTCFGPHPNPTTGSVLEPNTSVVWCNLVQS